MKKIVTLGILMICLLVAVRMTTFANAESIEEVSFVDADDVVDEKNVERGDSGIIEDMLKEEEDIQYYAYLTLDDADPSLAPVIIEARNRIIFRQSWVADGLKGYVYTRGYDRDSSSWYKNYYNVGYSNAKTGASLGWKTNIESWDTFGITPPANTKVAVRASMYSDNPEVESGNWDIDVFAFCEILNS